MKTIDELKEAIRETGNVTVRGLGSFKVVMSNRTIARNPRTNEPMTIKPKPRVKFRASKALLAD
jgi:nucleoid DNA-binding protein